MTRTVPWLALLLWLLVVVSALVQIIVVHQHRLVLQDWQQQDALRHSLLLERTQLTLEISTLTSQGRVDQLARSQRAMIDPNDIQVLY
ncbi:MAG: cell division protein FtsL [Bacterioplanes sp.]|nr:cell division protein FtsL [Bacterioplanes sp.]